MHDLSTYARQGTCAMPTYARSCTPCLRMHAHEYQLPKHWHRVLLEAAQEDIVVPLGSRLRGAQMPSEGSWTTSMLGVSLP